MPACRTCDKKLGNMRQCEVCGDPVCPDCAIERGYYSVCKECVEKENIELDRIHDEVIQAEIDEDDMS